MSHRELGVYVSYSHFKYLPKNVSCYFPCFYFRFYYKFMIIHYRLRLDVVPHTMHCAGCRQSCGNEALLIPEDLLNILLL